MEALAQTVAWLGDHPAPFFVLLAAAFAAAQFGDKPRPRSYIQYNKPTPRALACWLFATAFLSAFSLTLAM